MLRTSTPFPFPGSKAMLDGLVFTVQRHNADGSATISREGDGASFRRDAPIDQLVDPAEAQDNATAALFDVSAATARIALWIARHLREANSVTLSALRRDLDEAARIGRIPAPADNIQVARILRRLGWRKQGMARHGYDRSPLYVRGEA